jgi:hypothetical protein
VVGIALNTWGLDEATAREVAEELGLRRSLDILTFDCGGDAPDVRGLDLIAPDLGWRHLDERTRTAQQRRFALGVESACERLGLGPLSRRGPLPH